MATRATRRRLQKLLDIRKFINFFCPNDALLTSSNNGHTNHAPNARVRRGNWHFEVRSQDQPNRSRGQDAHATVHQQRWIVSETLVIRNAFTDRFSDVRTHEQSSSEFANSGEHNSHFDRNRPGSDRSRKRVCDIIRTDTERGEKAQECAKNKNCCCCYYYYYLLLLFR